MPESQEEKTPLHQAFDSWKRYYYGGGRYSIREWGHVIDQYHAERFSKFISGIDQIAEGFSERIIQLVKIGKEKEQNEVWLKGGEARGKIPYSEAWLRSKRDEHNTSKLNLGYSGPRHSIEINFRMLKRHLPDTVWLSMGSDVHIDNSRIKSELTLTRDWLEDDYERLAAMFAAANSELTNIFVLTRDGLDNVLSNLRSTM